MQFLYSSFLSLNAFFLVFCRQKTKHENCLVFQAVSVLVFSITKHIFFGVLKARIEIQKLATIVGSFCIRIFHHKAHVSWCLAGKNINSVFAFSLAIYILFCALQAKNQIRTLLTFVGCFRIRGFPLYKAFLFWSFES